MIFVPSWDEVLNNITAGNGTDNVRKQYLKNLSNYTDRNVIAYYSAFLSPQAKTNLDINDDDVNGFMSAIYGMDKKKGLDLILHTPGGSPTATEAIVDYLRNIFGTDIRVIVPQIAMSAGTLIACSAKEIIMGKHSSLGPIDPQVNGIPAYNIVREFTEAKQALSEGKDIEYWKIILPKYPPAFVYHCIDSIDLSDTLACTWLKTGMFKDDTNADDLAHHVTDSLNEHQQSKNHGRHFGINQCRKMGLKILNLEDDKELQEHVLSVHHAQLLTFTITLATKIIESETKSYIKLAPSNVK